MKNFSVTQLTNYASIIGVVIVLLNNWLGTDYTTDDVFNITYAIKDAANLIVTAAGIILTVVANVISLINRYKKGDVTVAGAYKR